MWALRRASIHLKNRGLSSGLTGICCVKTEIAYHDAGVIESQRKILDALAYSRRFYSKSSPSGSCMQILTFSSQASSTSSGEKDDILEVALSDDDLLVCDSELSEGERVTDYLQHDVGKLEAPSAMAKAILADPSLPVRKVMDEWVQEGKKVTQDELSITIRYLRKCRMFSKALTLSEWVDSAKQLELKVHYASRIDLIANVHGIIKAEEYIHQIPEYFRDERVYGSLLANCVRLRDTKRSEELFNTMKNLFPLGDFSCNKMLLLYSLTNKKKLVDVLSFMEKENIEPSIFTYQILIDVKGRSNDISGMEKIIEAMKSKGVEPDTNIQASLARYYADCGLKDKAEAVLEAMEGDDLTEKHWLCRYLLPVYASLGRDDEVERIWKVCESNPRPGECVAAIEAWGQLNRIEDAEAVFEKTLKITKRPLTKHFTALLNIYTNHNMLDRGKLLIARMAESGVTNDLVFDALVKFYAGVGDVEKAVSVLEWAIKQNKRRPLVTSFLTVLDEYARRGDIDNAEKIFSKMRWVGYHAHIRPYRSLLNAYVNAKRPAYGFVQRMTGDSVLPDKSVGALLAQIHVFKTQAAAK